MLFTRDVVKKVKSKNKTKTKTFGLKTKTKTKTKTKISTIRPLADVLFYHLYKLLYNKT